MNRSILWCALLVGAGCNEILGLDADFSVAGDGPGGGDVGGEAEGGQPSSGGSPSNGGGGVLADGGGGAGTGAGAEGGMGGGPPVEADCDTYCDNVSNACSNANVEYLPSVCPVMCEFLTKGHVGDTSGDTVGCRLTQAELAEDDPVANCQAAGPLGADACSDPCDAFCTLVFATCSLSESVPFDSFGECQAECAGWPYLRLDDGGSDVTMTSGNNLNCRLYHLQAANNPGDPNSAATHCYHVVAACN